MIITEKKDRRQLLENIKDYNSFFLIGCSECASLCGTGGDPELKEMTELLEKKKKKVTGAFVYRRFVFCFSFETHLLKGVIPAFFSTTL